MLIEMTDFAMIWNTHYLHFRQEEKAAKSVIKDCNIKLVIERYFLKNNPNWARSIVLSIAWLLRISFLNKHFFFKVKKNNKQNHQILIYNFQFCTLGPDLSSKIKIKLQSEFYNAGEVRTGVYGYQTNGFEQIKGPFFNIYDFALNFKSFFSIYWNALSSLTQYRMFFVDKIFISYYFSIRYFTVFVWFSKFIAKNKLLITFIDECDFDDNRMIALFCKKNKIPTCSVHHGLNVFQNDLEYYIGDYRFCLGSDLGLSPPCNFFGTPMVSLKNYNFKKLSNFNLKTSFNCCVIFGGFSNCPSDYFSVQIINRLISATTEMIKPYGYKIFFKFHPSSEKFRDCFQLCGAKSDFSRASDDFFNKFDFCVFPESVSTLLCLVGVNGIPCLVVDFGFSSWKNAVGLNNINISGFGPYSPDSFHLAFSDFFKQHMVKQDKYMISYFNIK